MRRLLLIITFIAMIAVVGPACGGGGGSETTADGDGTTAPSPTGVTVVPVGATNSELVVGPNRLAVALDEDQAPVLDEPGISVHFRLLFGDEVQSEHDATFVWAIEDVAGYFVAGVDLDQPGDWQVEVTLTRDGQETTLPPEPFAVVADNRIPAVGDPAPPSENLTLAREPNIKRLSTDQDPEPALYQLTIAEALETDRPLVVVFATPAFCETRFCGPVVENVREVWTDYGDRVDFIHIEPFELDDDSQLVSMERDDGGFSRVPVSATLEWNLPTEPWIFVVGADGIITARIEGAASPAEVAAALDETLG